MVTTLGETTPLSIGRVAAGRWWWKVPERCKMWCSQKERDADYPVCSENWVTVFHCATVRWRGVILGVAVRHGVWRNSRTYLSRNWHKSTHICSNSLLFVKTRIVQCALRGSRGLGAEHDTVRVQKTIGFDVHQGNPPLPWNWWWQLSARFLCVVALRVDMIVLGTVGQATVHHVYVHKYLHSAVWWCST
jgi:hypothetical protein